MTEGSVARKEEMASSASPGFCSQPLCPWQEKQALEADAERRRPGPAPHVWDSRAVAGRPACGGRVSGGARASLGCGSSGPTRCAVIDTALLPGACTES